MKRWMIGFILLISVQWWAGNVWSGPTEEVDMEAVRAYFLKYNQHLQNKPITTRPTRRHVEIKRKQTVLERDEWTCQICSQKYPLLEVDHAIALQNGGKNAQTNLFALCPKCHDAKTELDLQLNHTRRALPGSIRDLE